MDTKRLQELAGIPLNEEMPDTTKENPLVFVWEGPKSIDYPEQGISGHMHLTTAAKIHQFDTKGLAEKLWSMKVDKEGTDRIKAGKVWLSMSHWTRKELTEAIERLQLTRGWDIVVDGEDVVITHDNEIIAPMTVDEWMGLMKKFNKIQRGR